MIRLCPALAEIKQQQHRIGRGQGLLAAADAQPFHQVIGGPDAGGVQQGERHAVQHQFALQQVAGGARQIGHDRPIPATEQVEQARFAHIGAAHNRHPQPLAQQLPLAGLRHQPLQGGAHRRQLRQHGAGIEGRQILLKIHPRLQLRQLIQQPFAQAADASLQAAIDAGHGQLGRPATAGVDHFANRLSPGEIEPTVEKSSLAEFPRQSPAGSGGQHQLQHPLNGHQAAVAVEFHHGFAGKTAGCPHQQQQRLIHPLAAGRIHHMAVEHPMALPVLLARGQKQALADRLRPFAGEAQDCHAALARGDGGGDGNDGVAGVAWVTGVAWITGITAVAGVAWVATERNGLGHAPIFSPRPLGPGPWVQELARPGNTIRSMWLPVGWRHSRNSSARARCSALRQRACRSCSR